MDLQILKDTPSWEWPRGVGLEFLTILEDPKATKSDRLLAAELAGDFTVIDDPLAEVLLAILANSAEPEALRGRAAISLGPALEQADIDEFDDPESVPISEATFHRIKETLRRVYVDNAVPKFVRRSILEAAVRAPEEWHTAAIRAAWSSGDAEWKLTAAFCMTHVRGFDQEILEALDSADPLARHHAVVAAGNWEVEGAWDRVSRLALEPRTEKYLRLAAIEALAYVRPREARTFLLDLIDDDDEDIAEAASEATSTAENLLNAGFDDEDEDYGEFDDDEDDEEDETIH